MPPAATIQNQALRVLSAYLPARANLQVNAMFDGKSASVMLLCPEVVVNGTGFSFVPTFIVNASKGVAAPIFVLSMDARITIASQPVLFLVTAFNFKSVYTMILSSDSHSHKEKESCGSSGGPCHLYISPSCPCFAPEF
jgi:hypothetical protein